MKTLIKKELSTTVGQRAADRFAGFVGSWKFIIIQSSFLFAWIVFNVTPLGFSMWDRYPFILLNLFLSFQAAYTGPIILMATNRQSEIDRRTWERDVKLSEKIDKVVKDDFQLSEAIGSMVKTNVDLSTKMDNTLRTVSGIIKSLCEANDRSIKILTVVCEKVEGLTKEATDISRDLDDLLEEKISDG